MSESDESFMGTPPILRENAQKVYSELLAEKSLTRYMGQYNMFINWCSDKKVKNYSENVVLAYFTELVSQNKKSLWARYSMIKSCLIVHNNIDISKYSKLIAYLKRKTKNRKPKKSKILEEEHIQAFIEQAPDDKYLMMKVVLIIGVSGALLRAELHQMTMKNIEFKEDIIIITISDTKNKVPRNFVINKSEWVDLIKKYLNIRVKASKIQDRFFLRYQNGKCVNAPVGINTFGGIPLKIASFLHLNDPKDYTGHCFRRSSATLLATHGGDILTIKKHGGWKSASVAEVYIDDSLKRKIDVADILHSPDHPHQENHIPSFYIR